MGKKNASRLIWVMVISLVLIAGAGYVLLKGSTASALMSPINTLLSPIDEKTNFVIFGMDESGLRTDSIIAGCLNTREQRISLLSIPRDTLVTVPGDRLAVMKQRSSYAPDNGQMKINAVYAYGGKEYGAEFTVKQIEELLGVRIKYYITVDLEAFRYIVDAVGGVTYDVPFRMKYTDPVQGLNIDLQPGVQLLNGAQAEGLVRYRKSNNGSHPEYTDISRSQTQQAFIKAVIKKVTSQGNMAENAAVLLQASQKYTSSNINAADAAKYLQHVQEFKNYDISLNTLVSTDKYIDGVSYVIVDTESSGGIVDSVFGLTADDTSGGSKGIPILVLNGGSVSGIAARARDFLTEQGFTVSGIGDYTGKRVAYTRVFVKRSGMGKDIQALFPGSRIIADGSEFEEDIAVVLGLDER